MSHPIGAETLMEDESHHADADIPPPVRSDPGSGLELSTKLWARIEKLADRRIDPSSIEFQRDTMESSGGHATVSKAFRPWEFVAVKKMRIADDTDIGRVLGLAIREAEFQAELSHPNIIGFKGFVEDIPKSIIWLVFPWVDNGNLRDFVALRNWEIPERISLINDVTQGLAYLHSREPPVCHGDLKSLNMLVDRHHRVAITDFGSARRLSQRDSNMQIDQVESQAPPRQSLNLTFCASTNTITLTGNKYTLRWAAPELLVEDQLSLWSDIWALGWIAYEVMTNSLPFQDASTDIVVIQRVLRGELPSLTDNAHLSLIQELCSLMNMCWKNNPIERPTADYCRESIKQMPMFVPDLDDFNFLMSGKPRNRTFSVDRLTELGYMYQSRGEYTKAFEFFVKALEASRMHSKRDMLASSLRNLAQLHRLRKEYNEALPLYSEALRICEDLSKDTEDAVPPITAEWTASTNETEILKIGVGTGRCDRADALLDLAGLHRLRTEYEKAIPLYSEAWKIFTDLKNRKGKANVLLGLADVHRLQRGYEKAIPLYSEALKIFTEHGDKNVKVNVLLGLADVHRLQKEYEKAIPLYSEALEILTDLGDRKGKISALWSLAVAHRLQKEYDKAIPLYSEALKILTEPGDRKGRADVLVGLADVHRLRREYEKAIPLYSEALEILTDLGDRKGKISALWSLAVAHRLQKEYDKAIPLYSEALKILTEPGDRKGRADVLLGLADVHRFRREYDMAISLYSKVLAIRTHLRDREGRAYALLGLAKVHRCQNRWVDAVCRYQQAAETAEQVGCERVRVDALKCLVDVRQLIHQQEVMIMMTM